MNVYLVGGALRDQLLGRPSSDRDWVVVGATPQQMAEAGYLPVGRDFPVFLHPRTREEYALARTERKSGPGYRGFVVQASPAVTLEEDLARRDLTINAIALPAELADVQPLPQHALVDPFGGRHDLQARTLRHVTEAFREDPVRILRLARFGARLPTFAVAPETLALMRQMVRDGEVDALVPERVWQELARGLMEGTPSRMFELLRACGALAVLLPDLDRLWAPDRDGPPGSGPALMRVLDACAGRQAPLGVRFACLTHRLDGAGDRAQGEAASALQRLCAHWRVPVDIRALAELVAREREAIDQSPALDAAGVLALLERCDALRKPQRFEDLLLACECIALAGPGGDCVSPAAPARNDPPAPVPRARLQQALAVARGVDTAPIARAAQAQGRTGTQIGDAIHAARVQALLPALAGRRSGG